MRWTLYHTLTGAHCDKNKPKGLKVAKEELRSIGLMVDDELDGK